MTRTALVTGGTRGIGAAISKALKGAGYNVAASYAGNDEAAAKFKAETGIAVYKWDVASFDACAEGVKKVEAEVGAVDVLVNNAGITLDARLQKMSDDQFDKVIAVNLKGTYNCAQAVVDTMVAQGSGVILNASSVVGINHLSASGARIEIDVVAAWPADGQEDA